MDREEYSKKVLSLLDDDIYERLNKDPTARIERKVRELIKRSSIPEEHHWKLMPSASRAPRLYGLPKIHKEGTPLRPIVNTIGSPTYKLARFLSRGIQDFVGSMDSFIKNSAHFIEILKDLRVTERDILVSFDVTSLFTKVPVPDSVEILRTLTGDGLPEDYPKLVEFCLQNNYFLYNGVFYEQKSGAAMGSPLSPVIANLCMEFFEQKALDMSEEKQSCWLRYVDDTFVIWPHGKEKLEAFHEHLNAIHPDIKFTKELEEGGHLPFLDVLDQRKIDGSLGHSVYRKKTHTDRGSKDEDAVSNASIKEHRIDWAGVVGAHIRTPSPLYSSHEFLDTLYEDSEDEKMSQQSEDDDPLGFKWLCAVAGTIEEQTWAIPNWIFNGKLEIMDL